MTNLSIFIFQCFRLKLLASKIFYLQIIPIIYLIFYWDCAPRILKKVRIGEMMAAMLGKIFGFSMTMTAMMG